MKSAPSHIPSLMAAVTAVAALGAGALLAAEDRMLFEPQHAMLVGLVDDVGSALLADKPAVRQPVEVRRAVNRAGSGAQERR
jgi:hypothetical protein